MLEELERLGDSEHLQLILTTRIHQPCSGGGEGEFTLISSDWMPEEEWAHLIKQEQSSEAPPQNLLKLESQIS